MSVNTIDELASILNYIEDTSPPYDHLFRTVYGPNIVNLNEIKNKSEWLEMENHIYIGRQAGDIEASPWQNPYSLNDYDLKTSLKLYKDHVLATPALIDNIESIRDKQLACWCSNPYLCHGKVLIDILG